MGTATAAAGFKGLKNDTAVSAGADTGADPCPIAALDWRDFQALSDLYQDYAHALDAGDWELWPGFFTDDCVYRLVPRENHDRGLPLATLGFTSRGMLQDRVYGIRETLFHDPYRQRHVVSAPRVLAVEDGGRRVRALASYVVIRTKPDEVSEVFNVGRYEDTLVRTEAGWRFARRECIFDSEWIPNSIIYPI